VEAILADGVARTADEIRLVLGDGTDESIFWILRHLTGNKRGFHAQGDWGKPASMRFSKS
jgi:glucose-6-phosphate isomerase